MHVVLKELEENISDQSMNTSQQAQLGVIGGGCTDVLNELDDLLKKYKRLGTISEWTWDRMKWGFEDIQRI